MIRLDETLRLAALGCLLRNTNRRPIRSTAAEPSYDDLGKSLLVA